MVLYILGPVDEISIYTERITDTITISPGIPAPEPAANNKLVNIRGIITYTNGEPYRNSLVELRSEPRYTYTNEQGEFFFVDVAPGRHTISAIQDSVVLASIQVEIRQEAQTMEINTTATEEGSVLVYIPLDIFQIRIELSITEEGGLNLISVAGEPVSPGRPSETGGTPPTTPGTPPAIPGPPVKPPEPPPPIKPPIPGKPDRPPNPPDNRPGLRAGDEYGTGEWSVATQAKIFSPRAGNTGVRTINNQTVISPGAKGNYSFRLRNPESYALEYRIRLEVTDQNSPPLPIRYRLKKGLGGSGEYIGGEDWQAAADLHTPLTSLGAFGSEDYTLEWKWLSEGDKEDTAIGVQTTNPVYVLNIMINAWSR